MLVIAAIVALLVVLYVAGIITDKNAEKELARLKSLPNYYRLCRVVDNGGRELRCRVREWNIRPDKSELWCIDPVPHPNGWTRSFIWPNEDIEFLED
ncbi:hypothetical protein PP459_gp110 [Streptomyces phage Wakanda]|uniref:Uncharacterized protein n=2 Tax=Wakandavirus TaxID=3044854 RepID=A0A6G8R407_9CAUD|nr:hypothetical protein PP459_gp110 [Streptomyces phage Wakanda]YP_010652444.1 hypothetical protein PP460_gp114 [Streptomyces phage Muntaha]QIN94123.1 hypothetical protein SEA_WAKANDA_161 [Streptomyces phage Wakanda]QIN94688.1 hypothetical protein SEA_MUNTAHA_163 [Streptomyces phage Muntaha]